MDATARADKWLWAVRLFKTRAAAAAACSAGKVRRLDQAIKPATALRVGDWLDVPYPDGPGRRKLRVHQVIEQRVSAAQAALAFSDETPQADINARILWQQQQREAPRGRPTKKDRREIERFRNDSD